MKYWQSCIHELKSQCQPTDKEIVEYFTLGDLWNCYCEWSAYGAGTPVVLSNGEEITQYYVPYLSAIQIYTNKSLVASRFLMNSFLCLTYQIQRASHCNSVISNEFEYIYSI